MLNQTNIASVSMATFERLVRDHGGTHMGISERCDTILNGHWN